MSSLSSVRVGDKFKVRHSIFTDEFIISEMFYHKGKLSCMVSWVDSYGSAMCTDYNVEDVENNFKNEDWVCPQYIIRESRLEKLKKLNSI